VARTTLAVHFPAANKILENFKISKFFPIFRKLLLDMSRERRPMKTDSPAIYADLKNKLMNARFGPGEKLKPASLQGEYGCSANTVRDVLLRLTKVGLVEFEMQRGFRAQYTSPEKRNDVTRFRSMLEQEGVTLSMKLGGISWEAELTAAHHRLSHLESEFERSGDLADNPDNMKLWTNAEWSFHDTLISRCGSPMLRDTYENVYGQFRQQMVAQESGFGRSYFSAIIHEHQAILDAALSRDVTACRAAINDHLKRNYTQAVALEAAV